ncbi:MAG: amidohydrolase family protein, partial [Rhodobacterales bacterium]
MQTLLHNARVLTMNDTFDEYLCGWLVLEDEVILVVGQNEIPEVYKSADVVIDMNGDLIMPGMINTHCHMPMTLFRGLGEDVDDRLFRYILPLEREAITPEVVRIGANLAALEMMLGGVTTVADMYWFEYEIGRVLDVSGMRGIVGQSLADFNPPDHSTFDEGFAIVDDLRNEFCGNTRITASIAPHAPYSTGKKIMERVAKYAETYPEVKIQMHLAEMKTEMEWCEKNYKMRPVEL